MGNNRYWNAAKADETPASNHLRVQVIPKRNWSLHSEIRERKSMLKPNSSPRVAANPSRLRPYRRPQQPTSHFVPRIDVPQGPNPRHDETGLAWPLRGSTLGYFLIGATGKHART